MSESIAAQCMSMDEILHQLSSLKDNSAEFAAEKDADPIWQDDVTALEATISIMCALQDEGINDAEALKDMIYDYNLCRKQTKAMHLKFEVAGHPVQEDGVWRCPECNHRVQPRHGFCHRCGKKLGGW